MKSLFSHKWEHNYIKLLKQRDFRRRLDKASLFFRVLVILASITVASMFALFVWDFSAFLQGFASITFTLAFLLVEKGDYIKQIANETWLERESRRNEIKAQQQALARELAELEKPYNDEQIAHNKPFKESI